jgi:hypothetical protein
MLFRSEFPNYPADSLPVLLLASPFTDESYHNDVCPSFVVEMDGRPVRVFADFPDMGDREYPELPRFRAYYDDDDYGEVPDVASDDIRDVVEWLGARGVRFGAYVGGCR